MKCVEGRCEWVPIYCRTLLLSVYLCNVHIFVSEINILPFHVLTAIMFIRTCDNIQYSIQYVQCTPHSGYATLVKEFCVVVWFVSSMLSHYLGWLQ